MYSAAAFAAFDMVFGPWRARRLLAAPLLHSEVPVPADRPLILVANHISWWDGFLLRDVQQALRPRAPLYTIMAEAELKRNPWFTLMGALPLRPGSSASLLALLREVRRITAERSDAVLAYFPQGCIWPSARRPLGFQRGIELLIRAAAPCCIAPVALHIEPLNRAAPTAFVAIGPISSVPADTVTASSLETAVAARLDAIRALLDEHGERAVQHIRESA
jgi:1-acyl-sn-glycerol-3-phosphate acyltransferase